MAATAEPTLNLMAPLCAGPCSNELDRCTVDPCCDGLQCLNRDGFDTCLSVSPSMALESLRCSATCSESAYLICDRQIALTMASFALLLVPFCSCLLHHSSAGCGTAQALGAVQSAVMITMSAHSPTTAAMARCATPAFVSPVRLAI